MNRTELRKQLMTDEGLRLFPYRCTAGKLTIGAGRNIEEVGISEGEAMMMLDNDIFKVESQLDDKLPWWRFMSDKRQQVVANMCFNLGINGLLKFVNTLKAMQEGRYNDAADGMLHSLWAKQVGARAERLAKIMREG